MPLTESCKADIETALHRFLPNLQIENTEPYLFSDEEGYRKLIAGVTASDGRHVVVKLVHEDDDLAVEQQKIERQSCYSERLRSYGIATPKRYTVDDRYCVLSPLNGDAVCATVEDWCGCEVQSISVPLAYRIGRLLAKIHSISLQDGFRIGTGTLFGAATKNDVNAFNRLISICEDPRIDQEIFAQIQRLYQSKMDALRSVWSRLPVAATQGDISINNLVDTGETLIVFDYNNAGDEVLVSDMVLEGLLTAYEMDLPENTPPEVPQQLFLAFEQGYRFVRPLNGDEQKAAWEIYVLYDSLWFTKIVYSEQSVQKLLEREDTDGVNRKLRAMLSDLLREDDGRFSE